MSTNTNNEGNNTAVNTSNLVVGVGSNHRQPYRQAPTLLAYIVVIAVAICSFGWLLSGIFGG